MTLETKVKEKLWMPKINSGDSLVLTHQFIIEKVEENEENLKNIDLGYFIDGALKYSVNRDDFKPYLDFYSQMILRKNNLK